MQTVVTMFDTADVYGDGRSERCIAEFLTAHPGLDSFVATKMGRRADQTLENYSMANFRAWTDRSRSNLPTPVSTTTKACAQPGSSRPSPPLATSHQPAQRWPGSPSWTASPR